MAEPDGFEHVGAGRPESALHVQLRVDDVGGARRHPIELARQHASRRADFRVIQRSQHVGQPGWVIDQPVRSAEIDGLRTSRLTQDARERPRDVEVVTVVPEDADSVIACREFQRRDRRRGRVVDDQQFAGETARVEGG